VTLSPCHLATLSPCHLVTLAGKLLSLPAAASGRVPATRRVRHGRRAPRGAGARVPVASLSRPRARRSGVACRWRIRHKLLLGLGFVVGLVALLLGGALNGLTSYRTTIKTTDNKLVELKHAIAVRTASRALDEPSGPINTEARHLAE